MKKHICIGIPRALLYYRYGHMWEAFFNALDCEVMLSPKTDKSILDAGIRYSVDETCLSSKLFLGHTEYLIDKCDYIFIPRIANFGRDKIFCTKFSALPDMAKNTFRDRQIKILTCNIDLRMGCGEASAFMGIGKKLGKNKAVTFRAYQLAKRAEERSEEAKEKLAEELLNKDGLKILLVAHSYIAEDAYVGKQITDMLNHMGVCVIPAEILRRDRAAKAGSELSPTLPWICNRELAGAVWEYKDIIDGIILMSAFPCGPDSMVNDIIIRRIKGIPTLNLTVDAQDATAGLETRLESFVDILHFREGERVI